MGKRVRAFCAAGLLLICVSPAGAANKDAAAAKAAILRGHDFVAANCGRCHAVERKGDSPLSQAPHFRDLAKRYPLEDLAEALSEGIVTGHKDMPQFQLDQGQVADVIAYMKSLKPRRVVHRH